VAGEGLEAGDLGHDDGHRLGGFQAATEVVVDLDAAEQAGRVPGRVGVLVESDPLDEVRDLDRLFEVVVDAALEGGQAVGDVGPAGEHDDRRGPAEVAADGAGDGGAGAAGHGGVDDHHLRLVEPDGGHGLVAVGGGDRPIAVQLEGEPEQPADGRVVVGDQDGGGKRLEVQIGEGH